MIPQPMAKQAAMPQAPMPVAPQQPATALISLQELALVGDE
jgi:hypothetical protein